MSVQFFSPIFFFPVNMRRCVTSLGYSSLAWVQAEDGVNAGCHSRAEQDEITNQKRQKSFSLTHSFLLIVCARAFC